MKRSAHKSDTDETAAKGSAGRTERGRRTRERLIAAAIDEFDACGFHEAKISGIVGRAGLTQPTFYLYFSSKEAIFDHLVERVRAELRVAIATARVPAATPVPQLRGRLVQAIETFLRYFVDNPKLAPVVYFDPLRGAAIRQEVVELVSANLSYEQGAGFCREELDPTFLSLCYNGSLERLIPMFLLTGQQDARWLAEKVADLYGYGSIPESRRWPGDSKES